MTGSNKLAIGCGVVFLVVLFLVPATLVVLVSLSGERGFVDGFCGEYGGDGGSASRKALGRLKPAQLANAKVVVDTGRSLGLPPRAWTIALATVKQESDFVNSRKATDHDSVGLFQQRPSQGWGTVDQIMDPVYASTKFYSRLVKVKNWQSIPLTVAAQRVQRSAYPNAYARWEGLAAALVRHLSGADPQACQIEGSSEWMLPVRRGLYRLTARFNQAGSRWSRNHTGLDFAAPMGTPVYAVASGRIISTAWGGPYGNLVKIQHAGQVVTYYAHLSRFSVSPGQDVKAGQEVGRVGSTGNSSGPHIHLEVRVRGVPTDPDRWLDRHGVDA